MGVASGKILFNVCFFGVENLDEEVCIATVNSSVLLTVERYLLV